MRAAWFGRFGPAADVLETGDLPDVAKWSTPAPATVSSRRSAVAGSRLPDSATLTLIAALLVGAGCGAPKDEAATTAASDGTTYSGIGTGEGTVIAFLGIPFAEPPVGDLRWQPPGPLRERPQAWAADHFRPACMQGMHLVRWYRNLVDGFGADPDSVAVPDFSEDCLYLNVWTPAPGPGRGLPVMVWIHGGSNKGGWTYEPNYVGARLAREGAVVVSVAYRLGVLGYFSHPDLPVSNFGLLDQVAALRWVRDHIEDFGGDLENVSLFGESAGANAIDYLSTSPAARGLFSRAIHESGGSAFLNVATRESNLESGRILADALTGNPEAPIASLRAIPASEVVAAAETALPGHYYAPVVDGDSMPRSPIAAAVAGDIAAIDLIIGTNAHENRMYLDPDVDEDDVRAWIRRYAPAGEERLPELLAGTTRPLDRLDRLETSRTFVCPSLYFAERVAAAGHRAWVYYFARERTGELGASMGAYHGAEIPYVFGTHDEWLPTTADDVAIGQRMARYWVRFARSGDPNGAGDPPWPRLQGTGGEVLRLDTVTSATKHPEAALCEYLWPVQQR